MMSVGHVLDHVLDHMIICLVNTALHYYLCVFLRKIPTVIPSQKTDKL